jgi:hypothetical protein
MDEMIEARLRLTNKENQDKLANLWKTFGMESTAGKKLFLMYNSKQNMQTKVSYPEIKARPKLPKVEAQPVVENNPTPIVVKKLNSVNSPGFARKPQIHSVARRKPLALIEQEKGEMANEPKYRPKEGKDRYRMIEELQNKQRKVKFPGAPAHDDPNRPLLDHQQMTKIEESLKAKREKLEKRFMLAETKSSTDDKQRTPEDERAELNQLFDEVVAEIEDRQEYLSHLERLGRKDLQVKVKQEIVERISDLEKITKLLKRK